MQSHTTRVTLGGTTAPMCHGGGIRHKTISDLIRKIEYVDANGIRQYVTNPEQLKAAAGSFGLLGIITHITLELDKMTYATMQPKKIPVNFAIPPPLEYIRDEKIPGPLRGKILENREALGTAMTEFVDRATKDYYSEWFWFPYQNEAWVNTWYANSLISRLVYVKLTRSSLGTQLQIKQGLVATQHHLMYSSSGFRAGWGES